MFSFQFNSFLLIFDWLETCKAFYWRAKVKSVTNIWLLNFACPLTGAWPWSKSSWLSAIRIMLIVTWWITVGIWITNICLADLCPVFRSFGIQMPGSYYSPGKKIVDNLSTIQITIKITDLLIQYSDHLSNNRPFDYCTTFDHLNTGLVG